MTKWISNRTTTELGEVSPEKHAVTGQREPGAGSLKAAPHVLRRNWKALAAVITVVAIATAVWATRRGGGAATVGAVSANGETATVEKRDFVRAVRLHGTTSAVESFPITVPRMSGAPGGGQLIITRLASSGARIKKGDLLVEFDRQNQVRNALDRRAEYLDLEEQIKKKIAEQAAAQAKDQTDLTQARNDAEKARLETRKNEVISKIDAEKNNQRLAEAEAKLKQLEATKELKQQAYQADLRILEIRRDRAKNAMLYAEGNAQKMVITSPIDGLVVLGLIWKQNTQAEVTEGDEVRPGQPILQVVNPKTMEVRARVNQADMPFLKVGQRAEFRLDAFPNLVFSGKLERVAAMGAPSSMNEYVRNFAAVFSIDGDDARLLPDLAAAVDAEIERVPGALVAPRDALVAEGDQRFLRVRNGNGWEKRAVKVIGESDVEAALESGVQAGDVVMRNAAGAPAVAGGKT